MNRRIIGALLLLGIGLGAVIGGYYINLHFGDYTQKATSDAGRTKGKVTIAVDNWIGYFILRSPEMKEQMRRSGWLLACEDDKADNVQRMKRLKEGAIDLAVATVDSFILNGAAQGFPGTVIMVIDESKGGDAILSRREDISGLDSLKGKTGLRVAYTPRSPSHHLAKAAAYHFSVPELIPPPGENLIEAAGSEDALKNLLAGRAHVAVLWEPDVSKALAQPGVRKLIGTEETERLIVDVLLVGRSFGSKHPEVVEAVLDSYFRALKKYQDSPEVLRKQVASETGMSPESVETMLKGVRWANLAENCEQWFGIAPHGGYAEEGLIKTFHATVRVLINAGDFAGDPIPYNDPYRLINGSFLEKASSKLMAGFTTAPGAVSPKPPTDSLSERFSPLDSAGWAKLKEVGTLKIDPITFQPGSSDLDTIGKQVVDAAVEMLKHYPKFRVVVKGHTGTKGDEPANRTLSQELAESVARYLTVAHNMDPNRMLAVGLGGSRPLPQNPGESTRAWQYRLPRVEPVLVREEY
ncbi:MAG: phosphate ABC transporter substrate-binding/OmpA family protein [Pseudomonadota bacterium]